jgi:transposase
MSQIKGILMSNKICDRALMMQKLISKETSQSKVADRLNLSVRQVRRLVKSYKNQGIEGLQPKVRQGNRAFSSDFKSLVISTVAKHYSDFGPTLAAEKLLERHQLKISHETLRKWMIEAGVHTSKKRRNAKVHQRRERRSRYGELIQIDGSHHDWFEGRANKCCLLVFVDDATSNIMYLRFENTESTMGYMRCFDGYIRNHGIPHAIYSDKFSVFSVNHQGKNDCITQLQRAMATLDVEMILANSPQAKGRVERANGTLQDRLVKELRLKGISNIEDANKFLPEFIASYNAKFGVEPKETLDFHRKISDELLNNLDNILCVRSERKVTKNLELSYHNVTLRLCDVSQGFKLRKARVSVCERMNGNTVIMHEGKILEHEAINVKRNRLKVANSKNLNTIVDQIIAVPTLLVINARNGFNLATYRQKRGAAP